MGHYQEVLPVIALAIEAETFWLFGTQIFISRSTFILLKMKKDNESAAVVESEAQTLETDITASAAHDVQFSDLSPQILEPFRVQVIIFTSVIIHVVIL